MLFYNFSLYILYLCSLIILTFSFVDSAKSDLHGKIQGTERYGLSVYDQQKGNFRIVANLNDQIVGDTLLEERNGKFIINDVEPSETIILTWDLFNECKYVLWPLDLSPGKDLNYNQFMFLAFNDAYGTQLQSIKKRINHGNFQNANAMLQEITDLYAYYGENSNIATLKKKYDLLKEITNAASLYRNEVLVWRSKISEEMVSFERLWRRERINLASYESFDVVSDLFVSMNGWSEFSRQMYSRNQEAWPDKSINNLGQDAASFFHKTEYKDLMSKDVRLILEKLNLPHVIEYINKRKHESNTRLNYYPQQALDDSDNIIKSDANEISLSRLANLLTALNNIREMRSD